MATMQEIRQVCLQSRPGVNSAPLKENFRLEEAELDRNLSDEEVLLKTLFLSVDPYMRCRMNEDSGVEYLRSWELNRPCEGGGVGVVVGSEYKEFEPGDIVETFSWPWQTYMKKKGKQLNKIDHPLVKEYPSLVLGVLGMPGLTAYLGIKEKANIKEGSNQTIVVSGAAGACGSLAGQMARIEGCSRIVGICGSDEKCLFLTSELAFDAAVNYKKAQENIGEELKSLCPKGIDVYFDNVGGYISDSVIRLMNKNSHIVLCGQISVYNKDVPYPPPLTSEIESILKYKNITRDRFLVLNYREKFLQGLVQIGSWIQEGKLKYRETITDGIENMGNAFVSVMSGGNIGKQIVRIN